MPYALYESETCFVSQHVAAYLFGPFLTCDAQQAQAPKDLCRVFESLRSTSQAYTQLEHSGRLRLVFNFVYRAKHGTLTELRKSTLSAPALFSGRCLTSGKTKIAHLAEQEPRARRREIHLREGK